MAMSPDLHLAFRVKGVALHLLSEISEAYEHSRQRRAWLPQV